MKRIIFGEGLMEQTIYGESRFTVRKYVEGSHDHSEGDIVRGEFRDGLNILLRITRDTKVGTFEDLKSSEKDVGSNGYWFDDGYFNSLSAWYDNLTWDTEGAVIFFEILKVEGEPVVSFNIQ